MSEFTFTRVSIIQALVGEFESGKHLKHYIDGLRDDHPELPPVDFVNVRNKDDFLTELTSLTSLAEKSGEQPILHIEAHGLKNERGLIFPDGSVLDWLDLAPALAKLNRATDFNLLVCVAACFGGHFLEGVNPLHPSPCLGLLGPTELTDGAELLGSFRGFYRELLIREDANAGLTALLNHRLNAGGFLVVNASEWYVKLSKGYLAHGCTTDMLKQRAEGIREQMEDEDKPVPPMPELLEIGRSNARNFLDRSFGAFFMTDDIPANVHRFSEAHALVKRAASDVFSSQGH